jgi:hypothetical protein
VTDETGGARITETGFLSAVADGSVLVTASACDGSGVSGSMRIQLSGQPLPIELSLGNETHAWDTLLGGVIGLYPKSSKRLMASVLPEFPGEVLVDFKAPGNGFGYRFDLDVWDEGGLPDYWTLDGTENDPPNLDEDFQIFDLPNVAIVLNIPVPDAGGTFSGVPPPYAWQTPAFYGAECEYLFGAAEDPALWTGLPLALDFAAQDPAFNWANLRARRGHTEPYRVRAVILGEEPYALEGFEDHDGGAYGALVERYRQEIRARGVEVDYGVCLDQTIAHDPSSIWFPPLMDALDPADPPLYFDLIHAYQFHLNEDWNRSCPVAVKEDGFAYSWIPRSAWDMDYSRYLYVVEDARMALAGRGISAAKLGWSEHGITTRSQFEWNDMRGAIHGAAWISETMRLGTQWDSFWCLGAEAYSTALIQVRDGAITRTPLFYAYKLAMGLLGMTNVEALYSSPMGSCYWLPNDTVSVAAFPWLVVRAFRDQGGGLSLFVVNQDPARSFRIVGLESMRIESWNQVSGSSYTDGDPYGPFHTENPFPTVPIFEGAIAKAPGAPLVFDPLSIVRVDLR